MRLRDQVAVVTGAGGAVGSALVKHLEDRARHVVGTRRGPTVEWRPESERISCITGDLTDPVRVNLMVAEILRRLDGLHAWINVAGGFALDGPVEDTEPAAWPRMFDLNFITCLNCCQAVMPIFKEQRFGRIINFGAAAAEDGLAGAGPYCVSKAAVHSLTITIAQEGEGKVTANLILPGVIDTPANREVMPGANFSAWTSLGAVSEKVVDILDEQEQPPNGEKFRL